MLSSRTFALVLAAAAACSALPAAAPPAAPATSPAPADTLKHPVILEISDASPEDFWFGFPFFSNFFAPIFKWFPSFGDLGPNVIAGDDKFQVSIPAKNYPKDSLKVKVKNGFVTIQGTQHTSPGSESIFASQFFHTYSLPVNASSEDVTAELSSDGWLTVAAPVSEDGATRRSSGERTVEIKETGVPYKKTEVSTLAPTSEKNDRVEPTTARAEPTTAARDVEDMTENLIPHGQEELKSADTL